MPRPKRKPNAVVASAARVIAGKRQGLPTGTATGWQDEAWEMLDTVGELEFYREWISNALSRCTLRAVEDGVDKEGQPTTKDATDPLVLEAMTALFGGEAGQGEMLGTMGGHLAIPGETWLVGLLEPPQSADGPDLWRVVSRDEIREQGNKWQIDRGDGQPEVYDRDAVYVTRIWQPHPRKWVHANSSVRSALPILRELVGLSKRSAAVIDSRLAGAGLLAVPSEVTFAAPPTSSDQPAEGDDVPADPLMAALIDAMTTALQDQGDASAIVPIVLKAPAEHLDKIKHITFASPLDEKAETQRQALIKRLASSLDVPAEVLTGMADVNHWTGWLLDDNAIKMHIEPLLGVITRGLTTRYLWPILQGEGNDTMDPALRRFRIIGDTSNLRQRPNRSAEANAAHADLRITDAAWGRETGFDTTDLLTPESEEWRRRVLMNLAARADPALAVAAMDALGITINLPAPPPTTEVVETTSVAAPPAPEPIESRDPPEEPAAPPAVTSAGVTEQTAALLAVSETLVLRAVERGWNRAGKRGRIRKPVAQEQLDTALADAWGNVPRSAALLGVDSYRLQDALDAYARALLASGAEHDPHVLVRLIQERVLGQDPTGTVSSAVVAALGTRPERAPEQQPINLHVQVAPPEAHVQVNLPEGLVAAAGAPTINLPAPQVTVNVPEQAPPQVSVNVEPTPVTVENRVDVEPTPVTVENRVEAANVTVEAPQVTVDAPVTVEPTPVQVTVEQRKTRTKVIRDAEGNITGTEETPL